MKASSFGSWSGSVVLGLVIWCTGGRADAATHTWKGAAGGHWSLASNWTGGVPTSGESGGTIVSFGSSTSSVMDIAGLVVDEILFTGGGNTVGGTTTLGIDGTSLVVNIQSNTGTNALSSSLPLSFSTGAAVEADVITGTLTIAGNISSAAGSDGFNVSNGTTAPAGILALSGQTNTYTGVTYVISGVLELNSNGINTAIPGNLQIGTGGSVAGNAVVRLLQSLEIATTSVVSVESDGLLDLNGDGQTIGSLTLNNGSVTVEGATLGLNSSLQMNGGSITATGSGGLALDGDVTATSSIGVASITGNVTLNATTRTITVNSGPLQPELTVNGTISDGTVTPSGLTKSGEGTLNLLSTTGNTYTGTTTVNQGLMTLNASVGVIVPGALVIGGSGAANSVIVRENQSTDISSTSSVQINDSGELDLNGFSDVIDALNGSGAVVLGTSISALTVGNANSSSIFGGTIGGTGSFTKKGSGTLTLTGFSKNYTGTLSVATGTLLVNGTLEGPVFPNGPSTTVSSGATLGGSGTLLGNITTSAGGIVSPAGSSLGTFTNIGAIDLTGGTLAMQISSPDHDFLESFGTLNLNNTTLALSITGPLTEDAYLIAGYGNLTGTFGTVTGLPAGYSINYNYVGDSPDTYIALVGPVSVVTGAASAILGSSARLSGTVNPAGMAASYYFEYGPTIAYGSATPMVPGLSGSSVEPATALVSGLNGGTTYFYRLVVVNSGGSCYGPETTFTTLGPVVSTNAASPVSALSATLNGTANPEGLTTTAWFQYGPTTAYGSKAAVKNIGNGSANVPMIANLTNLTFGQAYHCRLVSASAAGTSLGNDVVFTTLTVLPPVFAAAGEPASMLVQVGFGASFTVALSPPAIATDSIPTYQWYKNGVAIAGAKSATYSIGFPPITLANAGAYSCVVKNAAGSLASDPAQLAVVEGGFKRLVLPSGSSTTLSVVSANSGALRYSWDFEFVSGGISSESGIQGAHGSTLALPDLQPSATGTYYASVSGYGGNATGVITAIVVYDAAPIIPIPVAMPDGIVTGEYSFQIPTDPSPEVTPLSYSATGLPPGLTLNAATGLISGRLAPVITTDKTYAITLKATNAKGSSPATPASLTVHPFPSAAVGTYSGLVARDALPPPANNVNGGLGGAITFTITSQGTFSGKVALGAASYSFSGLCNADASGPAIIAETTITRPAPLQKLGVGFNIVAATGAVFQGQVGDTVTPYDVGMTAALNPWNATTNKAPLAATYTAQIKIQDLAKIGTGTAANAVYPQGSGYATITVTPAGVVTWVGKMGDGSAPAATYTTTMDGNGNIPVHLLLDAGTGASQGTVIVTADTLNVNNHLPLLDGTLDWSKNAQPVASKDRVYKSGIPLFNLTVAGGQYVAPGLGIPVLGLTPSNVPGTNNAHMLFTDGGLTTINTMPVINGAAMAADLANLAIRITPSNAADFSGTMGNPTGLSLTLNAATGAMSGSFTLKDGAVTRVVPYYGLLVPRLSVNMGVGYFLLPELPAPTTTPMLSGQVLLGP